jgi:hypothetical protein
MHEKDRELINALHEEVQMSEGYDSDELGANREQALNYYYGHESAAPPTPGNSAVQSLDVADMVESIMSQVLPAFEQEDVVMFEAMSEQDEDQAAQETAAVNYMIMERNRGFVLFSEAIKDALLLRNGITKVWMDERVDVQTDSYTNLSPDALMAFTMQQQPGIDIEVVKADTNDDGSYNATIKITTTSQKLRVSSVDPTRFLITQNHDSIYLDDCPFVAERDYPTRSDLVERGYSKKIVDGLASITYDDQTDNLTRNRNQDYDNQATSREMETIEVYDCYYRYDYDGDGIAELRHVVMADRELLENEPADFVPYASGTPLLQPHRWNGMSIFDKLKQVQDVKTLTLRQWVNNVFSANNARVVYRAGAVNMDDLLNAQQGGAVAAENPDDVVPFPFIDTGASSAALMDYMDKCRSERGGASLDMMGAEAQIVGETAHGIERQYTAKEQLAAYMCRTLAETLVATTFLNVHKAMRLYMQQPVQFKTGGNWLQTNPSQWQERDAVKVKQGLSTNERMMKSQALAQITMLQQQMLQGGMGGILTDQNKLHNALMDLSKASGLPDADRYWIDPESPESIQVQQQVQQQQQQQQQMQMQQAQMQNDMMAMQAAFEKYKHDTDLALEYYKANLDSEVEEAKILGAATADLQKTQLQGEISERQADISARAAQQRPA